jgi:hypothetical protein
MKVRCIFLVLSFLRGSAISLPGEQGELVKVAMHFHFCYKASLSIGACARRENDYYVHAIEIRRCIG